MLNLIPICLPVWVIGIITPLLLSSTVLAASCPGNAAWQYNVAGSTQTMAQIDDTTGSGACENKLDLDQIGGKLVVADPCQGNPHFYARVNLATSSTTQIIPATAGKAIYLCHVAFPPQQATISLAIIAGTGTNCGTIDGTVGVLGGGITAATGFNLGTNTSWVQGEGSSAIASTPSVGDAICIVPGSSGQISGNITYAYE